MKTFTVEEIPPNFQNDFSSVKRITISASFNFTNYDLIFNTSYENINHNISVVVDDFTGTIEKLWNTFEQNSFGWWQDNEKLTLLLNSSGSEITAINFTRNRDYLVGDATEQAAFVSPYEHVYS